jgi:hypothetical protein
MAHSVSEQKKYIRKPRGKISVEFWNGRFASSSALRV